MAAGSSCSGTYEDENAADEDDILHVDNDGGQDTLEGDDVERGGNHEWVRDDDDENHEKNCEGPCRAKKLSGLQLLLFNSICFVINT